MGNLCNSNSSHHCCCCCFCCLNEDDKVELVLKRFVGVGAGAAIDNTLQKLVGRVVLANAPFFAPANWMPCVWYRVTVWEERVEHRTVTDSNGHTRHEKHHYWHQICQEEAMSDFYIQDGYTKVFIKGSQRDFCKIQGTKDKGGDNIFSAPPPGIAYLIAKHQTNFSWFASDHRTGRFKYEQSSFDVNELVAALGVVKPAMDPYTGQPCKIMEPIRGDVLSDRFFAEQKWEPWDIESWQDLVSRTPSVLLSDDPQFTNGVQTPVLQNLPAYMVYDPNRQPGAPMPAVIGQPPPQQVVMMQAPQPAAVVMAPSY